MMNGLAEVDLTPVAAGVEARNIGGNYVWQSPVHRLSFEACATDALAGCFGSNAPLAPSPRHPFLSGVVAGAGLLLLMGKAGKWVPLGVGAYLLLERARQ